MGVQLVASKSMIETALAYGIQNPESMAPHVLKVEMRIARRAALTRWMRERNIRRSSIVKAVSLPHPIEDKPWLLLGFDSRSCTLQSLDSKNSHLVGFAFDKGTRSFGLNLTSLFTPSLAFEHVLVVLHSRDFYGQLIQMVGDKKSRAQRLSWLKERLPPEAQQENEYGLFLNREAIFSLIGPPSDPTVR